MAQTKTDEAGGVKLVLADTLVTYSDKS